MSYDPIERTLSDVEGTLARAKQESVKFGSTWEGDTKGGRYVLRTPLGTLEGTYTGSGNVVRFFIDKKPRVVPFALIEKVLDQFLRG